MAKLDFENLKQSLVSKYKEYFPDSFIKVVLFDYYEEPFISIAIALGKDENQFKSGDYQNDPMYNHLSIKGFDKKKDFTTLQLSTETPSSIRFVAPITHSAYFIPKEVSFKATSGNADKMLKDFEKWLNELFINVFTNSNNLKAKYDIINKLSPKKIEELNLSNE